MDVPGLDSCSVLQSVLSRSTALAFGCFGAHRGKQLRRGSPPAAFQDASPEGGRLKIPAHLDNRSRRPHKVTEHMRRCASADPQQVALAKALGLHLSEGFTFVRRHRRGEGAVERRYRSISALSLLAATRQTGPNASFRDNWLEFERIIRNWLESSGWAIEQWSANRRSCLAARWRSGPGVRC